MLTTRDNVVLRAYLEPTPQQNGKRKRKQTKMIYNDRHSKVTRALILEGLQLLKDCRKDRKHKINKSDLEEYMRNEIIVSVLQ